VYAFDLPIEFYQGFDGGEHWSEGSNQTTRYLSAVPAGTYVLRLAIERSNFKKDDMVAITITQGVFRWLYWLIALLGVSLIPLGVVWHHHSFEKRRWSQSDFAPGGDDE
jgi:hypothetical protein